VSGPGGAPGDAPRGEVAAVVGGEPVWAAEVAAEVGRLRAGPVGGRLPPDDSAEGRQLRRWTTQRVVLRRLLEREAADRGLAGTSAEPVPVDPWLVGAAVADVLSTSAAARAVFAAVTADVSVPEPAVRGYYDRNADRFTRPPRWLVRQVGGADAAGLGDLLAAAPGIPVHPDTLPAEVRDAVAAAALRPAGPVVGPAGWRAVRAGRVGPLAGPGGWRLVQVDAMRPGGTLPYEEVRDRVAAELLGRRRQQAFTRWLDALAARQVRLRPGYEHPADPANPDATHRH
jgi:[acyl-carrier-protein] S-malonyltransferase